jgi:hypothetical protein
MALVTSWARHEVPAMTYRSIIVEEHPTRESATAPYVVGGPTKLGCSRFCSLNAYTWPVSASAYAR